MSNDLNPQARRRFGRNFLILALGTAASRGAGFARELATAAWVGGGDAMDRFVVAFTIPTLFRRILGEEMIERAVMPTVKSIHALGDSRRAWAVTWQLGVGLVAFLLIVLGILWTNTEWLAHIVGPGIVERDGSDLMVPLIRLILPFLVIIGMAAFVGGILLYSDMVRIYALAPMGLSIGVIAALIRKGTSSDATTLAIGFLLGGCLQLMALVAVFFSSKYRRDHGVQWRVRNGLTRPEARRISSQTAWVFMQSFAQKSVEIVDRRLASLLLSGSVSALWYAARLVQLPEAILGLAAGRAGLSAMAEKQAKGQIEQLAQLVHHVIEKTLLFMAPVAAVCFVASWEITALVYRRGQFGDAEVTAASWAFRFYALGLPALAMTSVLSRYHAVCSRNGFTLAVTLIMSVLNIILNYILVRTSMVHGGIAMATSIAFTGGTILLWCGFVRWTPSSGHGANMRRSAEILVGSLILGGVLIPLRDWASTWALPAMGIIHLPSLFRLLFLGLVAFIGFRVILGILQRLRGDV